MPKTKHIQPGHCCGLSASRSRITVVHRSVPHCPPPAITGLFFKCILSYCLLTCTFCRTFCIYLATGEEAIRKHGEIGGFPITSIDEVAGVIDPTTAVAKPANA